MLTAAEFASGANALAMAGGLAVCIVFLSRWWTARDTDNAEVKLLRYYFLWWGLGGACLFAAGLNLQPYYIVRASLPAAELSAWLSAMPAVMKDTPSRTIPWLGAIFLGAMGVCGLMKLRHVAERIAGRAWLALIALTAFAVLLSFALLPRAL